ncbi:murein L,D-transpeptidase catalytic domain-containing protein [Pseudoxanthomonas mexicana]
MTAIDLPPLPPDAQVVMLFDASQPASAKRFTVVSLDGPVPEIVMRTTVAHGVGSDPNNDGLVERFSNEPNSLATSLGQYKVAEPYFSDKWQSTAYRLDGLDPTNAKRQPVGH